MAVTRPAPRPVPAALPTGPAPAPGPGPGPGPGRGSGSGSGAVVPKPRRAVAHRYAALPPPLEVALAALRLEALLGDPRDAANPYGLPALTTSRTTTGSITGRAGGVGGAGEDRAGLLAAAGLGRIRAADQLVRALRPVLRRDVALGHACAAAAGPCPVPAALLGPAALLAATGTVLRQAARIVAGRCHGEPALRQWRPVLATVFADLLACESLTSVALRRPAGPASGALLPAVAGYVVPTVVADVLAQLDLVLTECGHGPAGLEGRMLAKLAGDLPAAGVDAAAAGSWQTHLVRALLKTGPKPRPATHRPPGPVPARRPRPRPRPRPRSCRRSRLRYRPPSRLRFRPRVRRHAAAPGANRQHGQHGLDGLDGDGESGAGTVWCCRGCRVPPSVR
ncbi:hypothetical protein HEP85_01455 [Streptomyces sp. RPA4-2]|uniref:hypothetical protein n=1 Tax=Streptomyces sp. RPA4-2 TaxID=2721244 RepID=UPI0034E8EC7A